MTHEEHTQKHEAYVQRLQAAIDTLHAQGQPITNRAVYRLVGGNRNAFNLYMRRWREEQGMPVDASAADILEDDAMPVDASAVTEDPFSRWAGAVLHLCPAMPEAALEAVWQAAKDQPLAGDALTPYLTGLDFPTAGYA